MLTANIESLGLRKGDSVLDIGCGEGRHCHGVQMLTQAQAVGVDLDTAALRIAADRALDLPGGPRAEFQAADAGNLPFPAAAFDVVICSEVLEHVRDMAAVIAEAARVIKPSGIFAVSVPRAWPERICWKLAPGKGGYADQPGGHVRIVDARQLRGLITNAGFRFLRSHYAHALHSPYWWIKTAFWPRRDDHPMVRAWHRMLVWDMMQRPAITQLAERLLNPVIGKSLVLYFERQ
jgi:SAM-dependent methyltransferase